MQIDEIRSIRRTWAATIAIKAMTGDIFYNRLFELAPSTRRLFKGDMNQQGMKLVTTLDFIVDHIDQLDKIIPDASALAIRHVTYGVTADQYAPVGQALIWTMQEILGAKFTETDAQAWQKAYGLLSGAMIEAAYPETVC